MIRYFEAHLEERIEAAKKAAEKIKHCDKIDTEEEAVAVLRYVLSKHYNIPYFSEYFKDLTIDQLFFEAELITPDKPVTIEEVSKVTKTHKKEVDEVIDDFDKWLKKDLNQGVTEQDIKEDPFHKMAMEFMQTGEFVGVKPEEKKDDK